MNFREYKNNKIENFIKSKPCMHSFTLTGEFIRQKNIFVQATCCCGSTRWYRFSDIKNNGTKSCGCMAYTGNSIRGEVSFFNMLELLFNDKYRIKRQHYVKGYRIDAYIPDLKIALEYDEKFHRYQKDYDQKRELDIKKELNCIFIRLLDTDTHLFNYKKIMDIIERFPKKT